MTKVSVVNGDISKVKSDSLITAVNSRKMWYGGIDGVIQRSRGMDFHSILANSGELIDGKSVFVAGLAQSDSFSNVIFVIDDLTLKLHEIVLSGLKTADRNKQEVVTLPAIRMGVMSGIIEKTEDEAIAEMAQGVITFINSCPAYVKEIIFVVYGNDGITNKIKDIFGC